MPKKADMWVTVNKICISLPKGTEYRLLQWMKKSGLDNKSKSINYLLMRALDSEKSVLLTELEELEKRVAVKKVELGQIDRRKDVLDL